MKKGRRKKKFKKKERLNPKESLWFCLPLGSFVCSPIPPRLGWGFYRFFFCLRDFLRLRIIS